MIDVGIHLSPEKIISDGYRVVWEQSRMETESYGKKTNQCEVEINL